MVRDRVVLSGEPDIHTPDLTDAGPTDGHVLTVVSGIPAFAAPTGAADITDIPTAETDTALRLAPDGAGGVEWGTGGSGIPATIFDAAGDIIVASAADTAARLAKGAAGGALSIIDGAVAWNSGTSFPGSPDAGDRYWRTDHGMEFYYDGTRWLTTTVFVAPITSEVLLPLTVTDQLWRSYIRGPLDLDVWLISCKTQTFVITTNTGANYWTVVLKKASDNATLGSFTTAADTADTTTDHNITLGVASTEKRVYMDATKTAGAPGNLFVWSALYYRLIGT